MGHRDLLELTGRVLKMMVVQNAVGLEAPCGRTDHPLMESLLSELVEEEVDPCLHQIGTHFTVL